MPVCVLPTSNVYFKAEYKRPTLFWVLCQASRRVFPLEEWKRRCTLWKPNLGAYVRCPPSPLVPLLLWAELGPWLCTWLELGQTRAGWALSSRRLLLSWWCSHLPILTSKQKPVRERKRKMHFAHVTLWQASPLSFRGAEERGWSSGIGLTSETCLIVAS